MIVDPKCLICLHAQRIEIDMSTHTLGQRATAKRFDVSRQAIQRHLEKGHSDKDPATFIEAAATAITQAQKGLSPESAESGKTKVQPTPLKAKPPKEALPSEDAFEDAGPVDEPERPESKATRALGTIRDFTNRKRYLATLLQTGSFKGMSTLTQLQLCWPDLTMLQLAEVVAQAAMEADFFRGTRQARRLVALARTERIFRETMREGDRKTALRAVEFMARLDNIAAEPDLIAALATSQAWAVAARVLQAKHPEAFEAIHAELVAEEARKRQALAPASVVESDHAAE